MEQDQFKMITHRYKKALCEINFQSGTLAIKMKDYLILVVKKL